MSSQSFLLVFATALLVVRPTFELFLRKSSASISGRLMELHQEGLAYRPNERDKPTLLGSSPGLQRLKRSAGQQKSDAIIFPDHLPTSPAKQDTIEERIFVVPNTAGPPSCARGDTFCESVDEYPAEHVIRLLKKEPIFVKGFFQDDRKHYSVLDEVQDRIDASDENPLCPAQEQTVYPKMARNIEGNWLFVINQDEYIQGVRVEKCLNDRECSLPASLPIGYRSQCKQKYIYRKLVALNGTGQGVISDSFQFPSCCSCVIKLDHNLAHSRFGGGAAPALPLTLPKTTPIPLKNKGKN